MWVPARLLLKLLMHSIETEFPLAAEVSASTVIVKISLLSFVPDTTDVAGLFAFPAATFTVQLVAVLLVDANTSKADVMTIMSLASMAEVATKEILRLCGLLPTLPYPTLAPTHATAVDAEILLEVTNFTKPEK